MAKRQQTAEQIIAKLREAEVFLAEGGNMAQVCRSAQWLPRASGG